MKVVQIILPFFLYSFVLSFQTLFSSMIHPSQPASLLHFMPILLYGNAAVALISVMAQPRLRAAQRRRLMAMHEQN
ncbi:MAG TPA: hypothetical protein V6C81_00230 [Planktothrix sp.]|jgi:hypothetical protein